MAETVTVINRAQTSLSLRLSGNDPKVVEIRNRLGETVTVGDGLNQGIDAAFFNLWLEQNHDSHIVQTGLIACQPE